MSQHIQIAANRLFGVGDGKGVSNFKLFPGSNREATPEQIAGEITKAIGQISNAESKSLENDVD